MSKAVIISHANPQLHKRPTAITIICLIGFLGACISISMLFSEVVNGMGLWFTPYVAFSSIISLTCMISLWYVKKWGLYLFFILVAINQIVLLINGEWRFIILLIHVFILSIISYHFLTGFRLNFQDAMRYLKRQVWAIIVAYMIGIHNFYKEEEKMPDDIVIKIEDIEEQEDTAPK